MGINGHRHRSALGIVLGLVLLVQLDLLVVEHHIAALNPGVATSLPIMSRASPAEINSVASLPRSNEPQVSIDAQESCAVDKVKARTACSYSRP